MPQKEALQMGVALVLPFTLFMYTVPYLYLPWHRGFHAPGEKTMRSIEFGLLDHFPSDSCSSFFGHRGEYWDYVKVLKVPSQKRQEDFSVLNMKYCLSLSGLIFLDEISFTIHVSRKVARETQTSFVDFV